MVEGSIAQKYQNVDHWVLKTRGEHLFWSGQRIVAAGSLESCKVAARFIGVEIVYTIKHDGRRGVNPYALSDEEHCRWSRQKD